jgi:hypothetical protein
LEGKHGTDGRAEEFVNRDEPGEDPEMTFQQLQQGTLQAERSAVIGLRNQGEINDEVLHRIERELDLEEQRLAGEGDKT